MQLQNWTFLPDSYAVVHDYELASRYRPAFRNFRICVRNVPSSSNISVGLKIVVSKALLRTENKLHSASNIIGTHKLGSAKWLGLTAASPASRLEVSH